MAGIGEDDPHVLGTCDWCQDAPADARYHATKRHEMMTRDLDLCSMCEEDAMSNGWYLELWSDYIQRMDNARLERAISHERWQ